MPGVTTLTLLAIASLVLCGGLAYWLARRGRPPGRRNEP
jgi:hypothetical protein